MGSQAQVIGQNAGFHILLKVKRGGYQNDLIRKARERGVRIYPSRPYGMRQGNCPPDVVMVGYGQTPMEDIVDGVKLLREARFRYGT